jgi:hypothetical protein
MPRPLEDWEYPDEDDSPDDDDAETVPCPSCGEEVYESAERCPHCGDYITPYSSSPLSGRPLWFVVLGLLGIVAVVWLLLRL